MDWQVLSRRFFITYKTRINAAERLRSTNSFIQGINIYYSIFLTILSIYSVKTLSGELSLIITVYSVAVTVTIVYLAAQNYGERAKSLKNNYVEIHKVYCKLREGLTSGELDSICAEYDSLISLSENHIQFDYYKAMIAMPEERSKLSHMQYFCYYFTFWGSIVLKLFLIVFPLLLHYVVKLLNYLTTF